MADARLTSSLRHALSVFAYGPRVCTNECASAKIAPTLISSSKKVQTWSQVKLWRSHMKYFCTPALQFICLRICSSVHPHWHVCHSFTLLSMLQAQTQAPFLRGLQLSRSGVVALRSPFQRSSAHCWSCREPSPHSGAHAKPRPGLLAKAGWGTYGTLCSLLSPSLAASWPWEQQQSLGIPLPSSNFPIPLPFGVDYLLGHPFITIGLATGLYVAIPRIWRLFVRFLLLPALAIAAVGFALQHPAATLSFASTAFGCEPQAFPAEILSS